MNTVFNDFTELVKRVRKILQLSQEDLAYAVGVSFATINRWENGKNAPSKLAKRQFNSFCEKMKIEIDQSNVGEDI